ncbi:unnamed protein product, partial [Urochloa humidicola]
GFTDRFQCGEALVPLLPLHPSHHGPVGGGGGDFICCGAASGVGPEDVLLPHFAGPPPSWDPDFPRRDAISSTKNSFAKMEGTTAPCAAARPQLSLLV